MILSLGYGIISIPKNIINVKFGRGDMRLWTIQPVEVYDLIMKEGVYRCDPSIAFTGLAGDREFFEAYSWLVKQMAIKVGPPPENVKFPVWAWHTRKWEHKKPDLRLSAYTKPGTKCVCIELEIPDKDVLLSDFDNWHFVLNNLYFSNAKNEEENDRLDTEFEKLSNSEKKRVKEKSWENIFDLTPIDNDWECRGRYIQATFWELKKEYIRKIQYFTAR